MSPPAYSLSRSRPRSRPLRLAGRADEDSGSGRLHGAGQGAEVVSAVVPPAVDEERRRARDTAQVGGVHVRHDPRLPGPVTQIPGEPLGVEPDLAGVPDEV